VRYRSLVRSAIIVWLAGGTIVAAGAQRAEPLRLAEVDVLRQALNTALQHDDVGAAVEAMEALLLRGVEPSNVALSVQSRLSPRTSAALPAALAAGRAPGIPEVLLLLAAGRDDWAAVDSLSGGIVARPFSAAALQSVGAQASEEGNPKAAAWAYERLVAMDGEWARHAAIPLADALMQLGRTEEAAGLLDSVLAARTPDPIRHRASVLRARLFMQQGSDDDALAILDRIPRGRPERADAELLAALIRFAQEGTESLATVLEASARLRPNLPEANDAYDAARLVQQLPTAEGQRKRILESLRLELRGRHASAAEGYRDARREDAWPGAIRIGIREARCWERAGMPDRALEAWHDLEVNGEDGPVVLIGRGDCLAAGGMADSARVCYTAVLERFPASPHAGRARNRLLQ